MSSKPLVSIAIPAYKTDFLKEAIASVLAQTYSNFELIIVNDCSPQDIDSVIGSFSDSRIRYYINEANLGKDDPANNWNRCLSYATGDFFAMLCDDDLYAPEFVQSILDLSQRYPECGVFRTRGTIINSEGLVIEKYPSAPEWESVEDYMWHVFKGYRKQTISEFMYRTEVLRQSGGYANLPIAWHADYLTIYRVGLKGGISSTSSDQTLLFFRQSGLNISSKDSCQTYEKLLATRLYLDEVKKICVESGFNESIVWLSEFHARQHNKWFLSKASFATLLKLYPKRHYLGITAFQIAVSLFRH